MAITDNLSAFYEFESGTLENDSTANGFTLTNTGTVTSVTGKVGNGASFTAPGTQELSRASTALLQPGPDFTIACWFKTSTFVAGGICVKDDVGSNRQWNLNTNADTTLSCFTFDSVSGNDGVGTSALTTNTWYFLVFSYDSATKKCSIYWNDNTGNTSAGLTNGIKTNGTSAFEIGNRGGTLDLTGIVDQLGFWQRVLTSTERTYLYNGGTGRTYAELVPIGTELIMPVMVELLSSAAMVGSACRGVYG